MFFYDVKDSNLKVFKRRLQLPLICSIFFKAFQGMNVKECRFFVWYV